MILPRKNWLEIKFFISHICSQFLCLNRVGAGAIILQERASTQKIEKSLYCSDEFSDLFIDVPFPHFWTPISNF